MHPVIAKTFGGLSKAYYFRQFIFGLIFPVLLYYLTNKNSYIQSNYISYLQVELGILLTINTILYPYSRFAYESIIDFIIGNNVFIVNAIFMLVFKFITMLLCWVFAIFLAPICLAYLYYHHSKRN